MSTEFASFFLNYKVQGFLNKNAIEYWKLQTKHIITSI